MTALKSFCDWFEGLEDILDGKLPNEKQWAKLIERVGRLRADVGNGSATNVIRPEGAAAIIVNDVDPNPAGTATTAKWKNRVKAALEEQGYDPESAAEVLAAPGFVVDLNVEPAAMAARLVNGASG